MGHSPYPKQPYFLSVGTQQRSETSWLSSESLVLHHLNEERDHGMHFFIGGSHAQSSFKSSTSWTLPCPEGWYIILIRLSITQLKGGRTTLGTGILMISLGFSWILGLLY